MINVNLVIIISVVIIVVGKGLCSVMFWTVGYRSTHVIDLLEGESGSRSLRVMGCRLADLFSV